MDHGLLAIDVLACPHRIDGCLFVPVVRRADNDGVDILARQDFFVVTGRKDVVAPEFLAVLEAAVVTVGHGDELHARNLHRYLRVPLALTARPNQRDLNVIVGRKRRGGFRLYRCQRIHLCSQERLCGCSACHFQKASTIQHECISSSMEVDRRLPR